MELEVLKQKMANKEKVYHHIDFLDVVEEIDFADDFYEYDFVQVFGDEDVEPQLGRWVVKKGDIECLDTWYWISNLREN